MCTGNLKNLFAASILSLLIICTAWGDIIVVNPGESIQLAIDASSNGDEIEVAPGTYNEAIDFKGKAIRLYSSGGPDVTTIDANGLNSSVVQCISGEDANTVLDGFTITDGNAPNGGGMYNSSSSPTVTNCTFSGNSASKGGGMYNKDNSSPTLSNCVFSENNTSNGGGMYNYGSSPTMTNCTFSYNKALGNGGGMYNYWYSSPTVTNCTFTGNTASHDIYGGGGMFNNDNSSPTVTNCTFSGNTATTNGGGMYNYQESSPTVTNCILWGDEPNEIYDSNSSPTVTFCDVSGGYTGTGNIDADPLFVNSASGDMRLGDCSPCVDAGNNNAVPVGVTTDLDGNPRFVDDTGVSDTGEGTSPIVDMGAYERQMNSLGPICNVTQGLYYLQIQAAIDDANDGDEIEVAPGTYNEAIDFTGKAVRLYSSGGPEVTIIDANGLNSPVVQCISGEDANTLLDGFTITGGNPTGEWPDNSGGGMFNSNSSPKVTNCTFIGNTATSGGGMYNGEGSPTVANCTFSGNTATSGGGMFNTYESSPTVTNCTFSGNSADSGGGGMNNQNSNPVVTDCNFSGNTATTDGGGMCNWHSSPTLNNCTFSGNTATTDGGGMYNWDKSSPTMTNCTFIGNEAGTNGGGMYNHTSSNPTVTNCTFSGNDAQNGGGMLNSDSSPTLTNCTFSGNSATTNAGGMYNYNNSRPTVTNCTFSGNSANYRSGGMYNNGSSPTVTNCILWSDTPYEIYNSSSSPTVTYCDVQGGCGGTGNIDADPCFIDAAASNLRLRPGSPCIDAGSNLGLGMDKVDLDVDGITNEAIPLDMDGYPRFTDDPNTPDSGVYFTSEFPIVDMGAYEYPGREPIKGDINCDGVVDFKDVAILCGNWLAGTEPE